MKYWAYINNEILGPYEKEKLLELPVFSSSTLLCPQTPVGEKTEEWKEASTYPEVASLLKPDAAQATGTQSSPPAAQAPEPEFSKSGRKLNTLTPHTIDPTPPQAQPINSAFEVNSLDPAKSEPKKDEPSYSGANFEPLTMSQIGKRSVPSASEGEKPASLPGGQPPEIYIPPAAQPAAPSPLEQFSPATEAHQESAPASVPGSADADKKAINDINATLETTSRLADISAKLENTSRTSATKQDIEQLKEKISQMGEVLASIKSNQAQQEIMENVQRLAHSVAEIKELLSQRPAAAPQASPAGREEAPAFAEYKQPKKGTETLIVDHGSRGKSSGLGGLIKKIFGFLFILVALAAILGGGIFALKAFGGPDFTSALPFMSAIFGEALGESKTELPAQPLATQGVEAAGSTAQSPQAPSPAQAAPAKKDLTPEIIYFGRSYSPKQGAGTLENKIFEDAVFKKGNFNKTAWQARELPNGMFELAANIPLLGNTGQLSYRYEVDYANKSIRPLDAMAQKPLDALISPKQVKAAPAKGRKKSSPPALKAKPAAKRGAAPAAAKPAATDDEEYEYVYEDEAGTAE